MKGPQPESALHGSACLRHPTDLAPCPMVAVFLLGEVQRCGQHKLHVQNQALLINQAVSYISRNLICCCLVEKPIAATLQDFQESKMTQDHVTTQDSDFCYKLPPATFQGCNYSFSTSHAGSPFSEMLGRYIKQIYCCNGPTNC